MRLGNTITAANASLRGLFAHIAGFLRLSASFQPTQVSHRLWAAGP